MADQEWYSTAQVAELAGVTYRQANYWVMLGLIEPSIENAVGSGSRRRWALADIPVLMLLDDLMLGSTQRRKGHTVFSDITVPSVVRLAREHQFQGWITVEGEEVTWFSKPQWPARCHTIYNLKGYRDWAKD